MNRRSRKQTALQPDIADGHRGATRFEYFLFCAALCQVAQLVRFLSRAPAYCTERGRAIGNASLIIFGFLAIFIRSAISLIVYRESPERRRAKFSARASPSGDAVVMFTSYAKACVMSAMRSSGCSIPIDMRIKAGVIPISRRASSVSPECTVVAGWQIKDSVPPRLTASLTICSRLRNANASSCCPLISNEKVEPAELDCRAIKRCVG